MLIRLGFLVACAVTAVNSAQAMTADELVAKNIAARGGTQSLEAIKSLRLEGRLIVGGGLEIPSVRVYQRPESYRFEGTLQGLTLIQAYDGKAGWRVSPFQGRKDPERMAADDVKGLAEAADFDGAWINAAVKGNKLEYLGTEDVDGTEAYKLKVSLANGDTEYVYFDPDAFLVIRTLDQSLVRGVEVRQETDYSDYEKIDGTYVAFVSASGGVGDTQKNRSIVDKAQANVTLDAALFAFPAASGTGK